jgi:hypothetical protein
VINKYKIEITPLMHIDSYGSAIDVTEYIKQSGIAEIAIKSDSTDFDVGVYTYDYVDITILNFNGWFSDVEMGTTKFKFGRDKAKVVISYQDSNGNYIVSFKGIINDEFTQQDFDRNEVKIKVLSYDSIFRKLASTVGTIAAGQTVQVAFQNLLNRPDITSILNYSVGNINPLLGSIVIDDASELVNVSFKEALDKLLAISCSVMYIDESDNIIIKSRAETNFTFEFWNTGDLFGRNNIVGIKNYNTGLQRAFNLFKIGNTSAINTNSTTDFGLREKSLDIDKIITDATKQQLIADTYKDNFSTPKKELVVTVKTELAKNLKLFEYGTIGYSSRPKKRPEAPYLYVGGIPSSVANNSTFISEGQKISENVGFKIIEKRIKSDKLLTELKLREIGTGTGDSQLDFLLINGQQVYIAGERVLI